MFKKGLKLTQQTHLHSQNLQTSAGTAFSLAGSQESR